MNKQVLIIGAVVAVLAIGAYLFLVRPQTQPATETVTPPQDAKTATGERPATNEAAMAGSGIVEITVENKGRSFVPNEIKAKEGNTVRVTFKDTNGSHNFVIDEFNVKTNVINANQQETVEFVADKKGSFAFYCLVPGHRAAGMEGTLIVE